MKFSTIVLSYLASFSQGNIVSANEVADSTELASLEKYVQQVEAGIKELRNVLLRDLESHNSRQLASLTDFHYFDSTLNMDLDSMSALEAITMLSCTKGCMSESVDEPNPNESFGTASASSPAESCNSCESGEPSNGGVPIIDGRCYQWCNWYNFCGAGPLYENVYSTDCRVNGGEPTNPPVTYSPIEPNITSSPTNPNGTHSPTYHMNVTYTPTSPNGTHSPTYPKITNSPTPPPSTESPSESSIESKCSFPRCQNGVWGRPGGGSTGIDLFDDGKCKWWCSKDGYCGIGPYYEDGGTDCRANVPTSPDPQCSYPTCIDGVYGQPGRKWKWQYNRWVRGSGMKIDRSDGRCKFYCSMPDPGQKYRRVCGIGEVAEEGGIDCRE